MDEQRIINELLDLYETGTYEDEWMNDDEKSFFEIHVGWQ